MKRARRVTAAILLAVLASPGTWLRTEVTWERTEDIAITKIAGESEAATPGWKVVGIWHLRSDSMLFGGFSALVVNADGSLTAFSDRGTRLEMPAPEGGQGAHVLDVQDLPKANPRDLPDIEAATRDRQSGTYWLALENRHTLHRFSADDRPTGSISLDPGTLDWTENSGAESLLRLNDGRFIVMPEGRRVGLIFPGDPVETKTYSTFAYLPPIPGHASTDLAQLPDGRVLLLLRNLDPWGGIPTFESKIAIGPAPLPGHENAWEPQITLDLAGVIPRDNYEGLGVEELPDGKVAVWLISDDNLSVLQRTLLVKLVLDPSKLQD